MYPNPDFSSIFFNSEAQLGVRLGLVLLVIASSVTSQQLEQSLSKALLGEFKSEWPFGDPRRCQELFILTNFKVKRFEILPGVGWDNLRNKEAGMVVSYNYSQCKVTDDGTLLIPDNVFTIPIKTSSLKNFAEVIKNYQKTSSTTSNTINVEAGMDKKDVAISGTFSHEHTELKSKQIEDDTVTIRVQLRYHRYEAKLQPDATLSPQFKTRLLYIAVNVELNRTEEALYQGQLLVRDFGTHVLTSITAGAGLVKDDYIMRKVIESNASEATKILASATATFVSVFKISGSFGHTTGKTNEEKYEKSMKYSVVKTRGPMYIASETTLDGWAKEVDANMVAMDKAGDPLYFLVTPQTLPELPPTIVGEVEKVVRKSVELYYEMNVIAGCTKLDDPNYSHSANFDDGSCNSTAVSLTFGGVFQTCTVLGEPLKAKPCDGLKTVNPQTGGESCPKSYTPVEIRHTERNAETEWKETCSKNCWFWEDECDCYDKKYHSVAMLTTSWCAATDSVEKNSGYLFGGLFTSHTENLVTGIQDCPPDFVKRKLLTDLFICISDDTEFGTRDSVPFGGFYSCETGNPLAQESMRPVGSKKLLKAPAPNSLRAFMARNTGPEFWPSKCPKGYSQHLATDDMGCAIHYCVQTGAVASLTLPPIKRPPFMTKPVALIEDPENARVFNMESKTWTKKRKLLKPTSPVHSDAGDIVSPGAAAGISVGATLACVALVIGAVVAIQKLRSRRRRPAVTDGADETHEPQSSHGVDEPESIIITKED